MLKQAPNAVAKALLRRNREPLGALEKKRKVCFLCRF
jgi:hypothetical protein